MFGYSTPQSTRRVKICAYHLDTIVERILGTHHKYHNLKGKMFSLPCFLILPVNSILYGLRSSRFLNNGLLFRFRRSKNGGKISHERTIEKEKQRIQFERNDSTSRMGENRVQAGRDSAYGSSV